MAVMNERADPHLVRRCAGVATAVSVFVMAAGLSVLAGWTLHIVALITWGAATPMSSGSASASVLAGLSLWLLRTPDNPPISSVRQIAARAASVGTGLIGASSLAEFLFHLDFGIDRLLLVTAPTLATAGLRLRMSPIGAGMFVLLSLSLLTIDRRTLRLDWPAQFLTLAAMMAAAFGSIGILIVPGASPIALALPTALIGLSLPIGIVCARAPWAIGGLLTSNTRGARLLRRTVPAALFVLSLIGLLLSRPLLTGTHISAAAATVLALFCGVLLAGFMVWIASIVDHDEIERRRIEAAQLLSSEQLDRLLNRIEEPAEDAQLRRKVTFALAFAILLTGLLGFLSWRNAQQATETAGWVAHTYEVMTELESALRHSLDVETGGRGFAETGSTKFLEPYESGRPEVIQDVHALRLLLVTPDQLQRLNILEEQTNDQAKDVEAIVATRQNVGKVPTAALFEHGKHDMDAVRITVEEMEVAERGLLALRMQRARAAQHSSIVVIALGSLLGVMFLTVAGMTVSREIGVSARARRQVKALNADLEQRVEQRTAALEAEAVARQESESRLAAVIKSAMDAIITLDDEQRIVLFSQAAEKLFQCPRGEAAGRPITDFIPHLGRLDEDGSSNQVMGCWGELTAVGADGGEFHIEASISQYEIAGRWMFTIILRDITERKQAEEMRERLSLIVNSSDDAIISKTLNGTITAWNRGAEKVFGYPAEEIVGKPMLVLLPPERIEEESDILGRIGRGESVEHFETVRVRKDGTVIDVSVTISPIRNGNGVIVGASKIARDITQRKQAEDALREKERRLSESQRIAHIGSWAYDLKDPAGRLVWSDELYHLYGVSSETFIPTTESLLSLIVSEDRSLIRNWMTSCAAGEKPADMDFRLMLPDGTVRVFSRRGELQYDADNKPSRLVGTSQDITERRQVEGALRESEERLLAMANGIPQLAWIAEADGSIYWYNQRWYEFTGTTLEQMQGWGWQSVHHPEFLSEVLARWTSAIAEGKPFEMEFPLRGADGLFRAFLTRVMPLKDSAGRVVRWFGTNTDISEFKRTQERLAMQAEELRGSRQALESQAFMLRSVLDSMVEGLVAADEHGEFILWNPAAEKIMGLGPTNLPSGGWSAHYGLYLPDTVTPIPPGETPLERTLRGEAVSSEIFLRQAGVNPGLWLEANGSPLIDKDGVLRGGVLAFRDITRRKTDELVIRKLNEELEEKIAKRTEQLEASNRELEAFSYSVSHDLRTPLRHIAGFSRILVKEFGPAMPVEAQEHLQRIEDAVSRMGQLIDALLKMAVLRRQSLRLRHSELNPIVGEVISMLQPECEGRDVEWRVAKLPALDCDPVLMAQVFQNLLGNAMKYSRGRAKSVIEVDSIQQAGKPVIIFVRDNGAGFDLRYAEKLFGVFQRFHTTSEFEGTGVGLATVHRIIQKHGGMIWADAEPDHGATFYFSLQTTDRIETIPNARTAS
jgi:PAS domain S-box-containing protein